MIKKRKSTPEHERLAESESRLADWKYWGPYLSERAWGTVREDYSATGEAWDYFPHDHARSRAYRWNEDGLGGFSNRFQNICLSVALWNERDPILKERMFGVTGSQGNHGEDVKEYYFYLDGTPTHSYMKMLYKYPQVPYPYDLLVKENQRIDRSAPEFEIVDALREAFEDNRYFDIFIEYAKADQEDILCRITAINRGPDPAPLHVLPHLWYRNIWSWGYDRPQPQIRQIAAPQPGTAAAHTEYRHLGDRWWYVAAEGLNGAPELLFTENETNFERLYGSKNPAPFVKDGINSAVVDRESQRVNLDGVGSKVAGHMHQNVPPGESFTVKVRFSDAPLGDPFEDFEDIIALRFQEADSFYEQIAGPGLDEELKRVQRQAFAGLMWTKQFYHYSVDLWLNGDPGPPPPPEPRQIGRNAGWAHLYSLDVVSMPDKWEYPWFAAWDLAFHMLPIAMIDPEWAKRQLILLTREWYMHPNGQLPAYEWAFDDVNPPVHAWAALRVFEIERDFHGSADTDFLERIFHKLLLNFTWWVNCKDHDGNNVFQGGFLGLDNIGVFDRSRPLPTGGHLDQADGTAWMAMYSLNMLAIALELARSNQAYEDVATKFFEHFIYIVNAFYDIGGQSLSLWDEQDGFFYDVLHTPDGHCSPLKIRSFVGLIPLIATMSLEPELLETLPRFRRRVEWFLKYRPQLIQNISWMTEPGAHGHYQLSVVGHDRLKRILERVFDPGEFLSEYGLRALSRFHADHPYKFVVGGEVHSVKYEPAESSSGLFGGNSNWRGPIWFPVNYLVIEALRQFAHHFGDTLRVEAPLGSGNMLTLDEAAELLSRRLVKIFLPDPLNDGRRPFYGGEQIFQHDPHWRDHLLFYEYFNGDNGAGIGASHQTGWTALVANLIQWFMH